MRSNLAEKAKFPGFGAAVAVFTGKRQALSGQCQSLLQPAGEQIRLAEMHDQRRPPLEMPHGFHGRQSLLEQRKALGNTTRQRVQIGPARPRPLATVG